MVMQPESVLRLDTEDKEAIEAEWRPAVEFMENGTVVEYRLKNLGDVKRWPSNELLEMTATAARIAKINPRNEKAVGTAIAAAPGIVKTSFYDPVSEDLLAAQPPARLLQIAEYFQQWLTTQKAEADAEDAS